MCACETKRGAEREGVRKGGTCVCVCARFSVVIIIIT